MTTFKLVGIVAFGRHGAPLPIYHHRALMPSPSSFFQRREELGGSTLIDSMPLECLPQDFGGQPLVIVAQQPTD